MGEEDTHDSKMAELAKHKCVSTYNRHYSISPGLGKHILPTGRRTETDRPTRFASRTVLSPGGVIASETPLRLCSRLPPSVVESTSRDGVTLHPSGHSMMGKLMNTGISCLLTLVRYREGFESRKAYKPTTGVKQEMTGVKQEMTGVKQEDTHTQKMASMTKHK